MGLETGTYIDSLNANNPVSGDGLNQSDDHHRLIKATIKASFPNISGAMTSSHTELNLLDGETAVASANTASAIVKRDGSGNFAAGTITADLTGTASAITATDNTADETTYLTFVDGATGSQGIETNTGLTYNPSTGVLTAGSFSGTTSAVNITVADESTDTTCFPVFTTAATGDLPPKTGTNLAFNSATGALTATSFVGDLTGFSNTQNDDNVGGGYQTLASVTTGVESTAFGYQALTGATGGGGHVAVGYGAGSGVTSSVYCVFIGHSSGGNVASTTNYNVGVGVGTCQYSESNDNIGVGRNAAKGNSGGFTGSSNTCVGADTMPEGTTGAANTFIGLNAGKACTTGSSNTASGSSAGTVITTGDNNLCLGKESGTATSPVTVTTQDNIICLGNSSITASHIQVDWTVASDQRDKTDITDFNHGLDYICNLRPVTYKWDNRDWYENRTPNGTKKQDDVCVGFLAQEVKAVEESIGLDFNAIVNSKNPDKIGMTSTKLIPVLVNAIKELEERVKELETNYV